MGVCVCGVCGYAFSLYCELLAKCARQEVATPQRHKQTYTPRRAGLQCTYLAKCARKRFSRSSAAYAQTHTHVQVCTHRNALRGKGNKIALSVCSAIRTPGICFSSRQIMLSARVFSSITSIVRIVYTHTRYANPSKLFTYLLSRERL